MIDYIYFFSSWSVRSEFVLEGAKNYDRADLRWLFSLSRELSQATGCS